MTYPIAEAISKIRSEFPMGLVEAKRLWDRFGSYEGMRTHLVDSGFVESRDAKIERLERELAEAVADKRRMDWLQLHREDLDVCRDLRRDRETIYVQCNVTGVLAYGDTLRDAVDAAMKMGGA